MVEQSTQAIVIAASPEQIMEVIGDFSAYPEWAGTVKSAAVTRTDENGWARTVDFVLDAGVLKDQYTLAYDWDDYPTAVRWSLVKGTMQKAQEGSYLLHDQGDGTTNVTYTLAVDLAIPMIGMMKRKAEKVIMDTALKELKKRVESL
ncbi:SRPBCC family protein [Cumulibacter manganitolerans]|uniref:SRPBCC family protein n=1 Tax=Cumulibacter manganitolerans TaxID=1884992 RepID=UPI0012956303|nr:SRPBCC family protein [Cumulibacter manganitolerans]